MLFGRLFSALPPRLGGGSSRLGMRGGFTIINPDVESRAGTARQMGFAFGGRRPPYVFAIIQRDTEGKRGGNPLLS